MVLVKVWFSAAVAIAVYLLMCAEMDSKAAQIPAPTTQRLNHVSDGSSAEARKAIAQMSCRYCLA